jgi:hypothetical protein
MDITFLMKAGFVGFSLSIGVLMLVFFLLGSLLKISQQHFTRVFVLAGVFSFLFTDLFLYYKIQVSQIAGAQLFLAGCVGGWLGGIIFGLTQMNRLLRNFLR